MRTATREALGTASLSSSRYFPTISGPAPNATPVTLPPGRARLATIPTPTGSKTYTITMGIVLVACLAAWAATGLPATMRSTLRLTSSVAREGKRSRALRPPILRDETLALHPAALAECSPGCFPVAGEPGGGGRSVREDTDPVHLPCLLRHGGERRGEEAAGQSAEELPPLHYSIT